MKALVLAEWREEKLAPASARLLGAAEQLGAQQVDVLVAGAARPVAEQAARLKGAARVWHAPDAPLLPEALSALLRQLQEAERYDAILATNGHLAHAAITRLGGLLEVMPLVDVVRILAPDTFQRPSHAGQLLETVQMQASPRLLLLRASAFEPVAQEAAPAAIEPVAMPDIDVPLPQLLGLEAEQDGRMLTDAAVVIGFGFGASSEEARTLVMQLAERLDAAVGCTRMVVDAGLAPGEWQIGQTGQSIAARLYLAFGISGAQQHLAGITDARTIIAINNDPEAPIFAHADYGLVADATDTLRRLLTALPPRPDQN